MLSNIEYDELVHQVINYFKNRKFNEMYLDVLDDIEDLQEATTKCNNKEKSFSSVMYEVKFLKSQYVEELKYAIQTYNEIIFKDFTFKNDLNAMINGPYALKMWLIRYVCLDNLTIDLCDLINIDMSNFSVTRQYQEIDIILFKKTIKNKKNILSF
jgi:hypothetical protein